MLSTPTEALLDVNVVIASVFADCRDIGNGRMLTCSIWPASTDWRWLRWKAEWQTWTMQPNQSFS